LFPLEAVLELPLVGPIFKSVADRYPGLEKGRLIHESLRAMIAAMVNDVITEAHRRYTEAKPQSTADVRVLGKAMVGFSADMAAKEKAVKTFLFANMYRHNRVNRMTSKAKRIVRDLFDLLLAEPHLLPEDWSAGIDGPKTLKTARRVADYIAGMTDKFALDEHARLFDPTVKP
jgi:dGTPase